MGWLPAFDGGYKGSAGARKPGVEIPTSGKIGQKWDTRRLLTLKAVMTIPIRGTAALVVAATIVAATAIWLPAYRWFLLISIGIGAAVAGGLYLWHKLRPVKEDDVENKRPLGLS
jgi:hypothetical protein